MTEAEPVKQFNPRNMANPTAEEINLRIEVDSHKPYLCADVHGKKLRVRISLYDFHKIENGEEAVCRPYLQKLLTRARFGSRVVG